MPASHTRPPVHLNSPKLHSGMHAPFVQIVPSGHGPSSSLPSQSLSRPLHCLAPGSTASLQISLPSTHDVDPNAHAPFLPVSHALPDAAHTRPVKRKTSSLKSPSLPNPL